MAVPLPPISVASAAGPSTAGESGGFSQFGSVVFREKTTTDYTMIAAFALAALGGFLLWKSKQ